jgi:hypothetical protein
MVLVMRGRDSLSEKVILEKGGDILHRGDDLVNFSGQRKGEEAAAGLA